METDTRKRRVNFSTPELEVLRIEVELRKSMLFAKLSSSMTREKKMRAWEVVAQRVSAVSCTGVSRTADEVRKKWSNIATGTKKRKSLERKEMRKTGGGPAHVTDGAKQQWDDSVAGIIGPTAIQAVEGGVDTSEPLVVQDIWDLSCNHTVPPPPHVADDTADEPATSASPQPATEMASSEPDVQNSSSRSRRRPTTTSQQMEHGARLVDIEDKRLAVEQDRLAVEQERLAVEKKRLQVDEARLVVEQRRVEIAEHELTIHLQQIAGVTPTVVFQ